MEKDSVAIQKKIQTEIDQFQTVTKDYKKLINQKKMLDAQVNENQSVLNELKLLDESNKVYKLYGPVLVKQELEESRQNIAKRIEFISKESKRCTDTIESLDAKQEKHRDAISKLRTQFQVLMAMK